MGLPSYEKLGVFYLGRRFDLEAGKVLDEPEVEVNLLGPRVA